MELVLIRIASLVAIAAAYMFFDVFNKRNVPSIFAYASLAYGAVLTLLYLNSALVITSFAIAAIVLIAGYMVFRIGQLGAADVIELAAISLILPIQPVPIMYRISQFGLPFLFSVLINTGILTLVMMPVYYIPRAHRMAKRPLRSYIKTEELVKAIGIFSAYTVFLIFLFYIRAGAAGMGIVLLVLVGSILTVLFEEPITESMVEYIGWKEMEEGDMIAFNLMETGEISRIKKKVKGFDRLVTKPMLDEMKDKGGRIKVPVYRNAVPLALPIFLGVAIALLAGNMMLFILPL